MSSTKTAPKQILEKINLCSDNWAGAHAAITEALRLHAEGRATAYGQSHIDLMIETLFNEVFEREVGVFFVGTGTAANALSMSLLNKPAGVIFAHRHSHMIEDECGAVEFVTGGARIYGVPGSFGRMTPEELEAAIQRYKPEFVHSGRPMAVSITQTTESGTVYSLAQIDALARVCRLHGLPLHMDGARFANALARLGCSPADMTWRRGVDILSFGATKNGCWCAEAIVVFTDIKKALKEMPFLRKRAAHLFSKTRFIAAQFDAYFRNGLWLENARNANEMAARLAQYIALTQNVARQALSPENLAEDGAGTIVDNNNGPLPEKMVNGGGKEVLVLPTPRLAWPVETNELFVVMDKKRAVELQGASGIFFYELNVPDDKGIGERLILNERTEGLYRLVTSFSTTAAEVDVFAEILLSKSPVLPRKAIRY